MTHMGHAGLPVDPELAKKRRAQGQPVYQPSDPAFIDQTPYREYLDKCSDDPREMRGSNECHSPRA